VSGQVEGVSRSVLERLESRGSRELNAMRCDVLWDVLRLLVSSIERAMLRTFEK
jgi:hypothetical protein